MRPLWAVPAKSKRSAPDAFFCMCFLLILWIDQAIVKRAGQWRIMKRVDAAKQVDPRAINSLQGTTQPSRQDSPLARRLVLRRLFAASILMSLIVSCKGQGGAASSVVPE